VDPKRISTCTFALRERPWREAIAVIAATPFRKVDLLGRHPHLSLDPTECDPEAIAREAERLGLSIANLGTYCGRAFADDDPVVRRRELEGMKRAIDIAVRLGSRSIRVAPGQDDVATLDDLVPWFIESAAYAAPRGIRLGFETHGGGISGDAERAREICRKVGSPYFGVLYDPCNIHTHGADYKAALDLFGEHIMHVHYKDATLSGLKPELTMLGEGDIDFSWVTRQLETSGYEGDYAAEYEMHTETPEAALPKWYEAMLAI